MQTLRAAFLAPNFTEYGFGLARCPDDLLAALQDGIHQGLPTARFEKDIEVINGNKCKFVSRPDLTRRVLQELKHYAGTCVCAVCQPIHLDGVSLTQWYLFSCPTETWARIPLIPFQAYGFRVYQNNSQLLMHVDRMQTHIVSFILHIDSSEDAGTCRCLFGRGLWALSELSALKLFFCVAEPWPIVIEDLQGRTHEVVLTPGDMVGRFHLNALWVFRLAQSLTFERYCTALLRIFQVFSWQTQAPQWILVHERLCALLSQGRLGRSQPRLGSTLFDSAPLG